MNVRIETDPTITAQVIAPPDAGLLVILAMIITATLLTALLLYLLHQKPSKKTISQQPTPFVSDDHPAIARLRTRLKSL